MQSTISVSRSARTLLLAALTLSASLTALVLWAGAAPAAPADAPCTIVGTEGPEVIHGTPGDDVICGLGGHDKLYGDAGHDVLRGGNGDDILYGRTGRDLLDGGAGVDRMQGGVGADVFRGGDNRDIVRYWGQKKAVTITIGDGPNDGTAGERDDVHADVEEIRGGKGDDTLTGVHQGMQVPFGGGNRIFGEAGNDRLYGGAGRDYLAGNDGDDVLDDNGDASDFLACGTGFDQVSRASDAPPRRSSLCETWL